MPGRSRVSDIVWCWFYSVVLGRLCRLYSVVFGRSNVSDIVWYWLYGVVFGKWKIVQSSAWKVEDVDTMNLYIGVSLLPGYEDVIARPDWPALD